MSTRLEAALARIDRANAADPRVETSAEGEVPEALLYGRRMSARLERFAPDASEALKLAARAQHIERWRIPRGDYPEGRKGYLAWRRRLYDFHAERARDLLEEVGYPEEVRARVATLVKKKGLGRDPEAQCLEDVVCLVFLEHYFAAFAAKHPDEKVIDILRKTWAKMSAEGREAALALPLGPERALIERALAG